MLILKFSGVPIIFFPSGSKSNGSKSWPQHVYEGLFNHQHSKNLGFLPHLNIICVRIKFEL